MLWGKEMKMERHTPGPWTISKYSQSTVLKEIGIRGGNEKIARVVIPAAAFDNSTFKANARLISAAPDLLDALIIALPFVEDAADDEVYKAHWVHKALKEIRAAIDKATD
jgi:hypothetical protein